MLSTTHRHVTAKICKNRFLPEIPLIQGDKEICREMAMFKIYRNDMTKFLQAKVNWPRIKMLHDLLWGLQTSVHFDSDPLTLALLSNIREPWISYQAEVVLWNSSLPSPQFSGFLNEVTFLTLTPCPSWSVTWWAAELGLCCNASQDMRIFSVMRNRKIVL